MRATILILLACSSSLMTFSASVHIECRYETTSIWASLPSAYQCNVQNTFRILSRDAPPINWINGTHATEQSNYDVKNFYFDGRGIVNFFPRGLERFFPNLRGIIIRNARLQEVHQSDLKPFIDLVLFDVYDNELIFLEAGLFDFNKKLEFIAFGGNKLVHIEHGVLDGIGELRFLHFNGNPCISQDVINDLTGVRTLVDDLNTKCKSLDVALILRELEFLEDTKLVNRPDNFHIFERRFERLEESFKKSSISSHEPITIRLANLSELKYRELLSQSRSTIS